MAERSIPATHCARTPRAWRPRAALLVAALVLAALLPLLRGLLDAPVAVRRAQGPSPTDPSSASPVGDKGAKPERLIAPARDGAAVQRRPQAADLPAQSEVAMRMTERSRGTVSGRVMDVGGGPIAGARISAGGYTAVAGASGARSDDAGEFRIDTPGGAVLLTAEADGYGQGAQLVQAPAGGVTILLAPSSAIAGRVVTAGSQAPVTGARVVVNSADGAPSAPIAVLTAGDGSFELRELRAGAHVLQALARSWRAEVVPVALDVGERRDGLIIEVVPAGSLRGSIRVDGQPCVRGYVVLSGEQVVATDETGTVEVQGIPPRSYEVTIECTAAVPLRERLQIGLELVLRSWNLDSGISLVGSVRGANGRPLAGGRVLVEPVLDSAVSPALSADTRAARPRESECVSDPAGDFTCAGLVPGEYQAGVVSHEHVAHGPKQRVQLRAGSANRVELYAREQGTLRVHVASERERHPRLSVLARSDAFNWPIEAVREGDVFVFEGLPLGEYQVYFGLSAEPSDAYLAQLESDGQELELELPEPRRHSISGTVVDASGQPVIEAWIRARPASGLIASALEVHDVVLSDSQGHFTVSSLLSGRYDVEASTAMGKGRASAVATGTSDVQLRLDAF